MANRISITRKALDQLKSVRDSGRVNMFDYSGVMRVANDLGYHDLIEWMSSNSKEDYGRIVLDGDHVISITDDTDDGE